MRARPDHSSVPLFLCTLSHFYNEKAVPVADILDPDKPHSKKTTILSHFVICHFVICHFVKMIALSHFVILNFECIVILKKRDGLIKTRFLIRSDRASGFVRRMIGRARLRT